MDLNLLKKKILKTELKKVAQPVPKQAKVVVLPEEDKENNPQNEEISENVGNTEENEEKVSEMDEIDENDTLDLGDEPKEPTSKEITAALMNLGARISNLEAYLFRKGLF